MRVDKLVSL